MHSIRMNLNGKHKCNVDVAPGTTTQEVVAAYAEHLSWVCEKRVKPGDITYRSVKGIDPLEQMECLTGEEK